MLLTTLSEIRSHIEEEKKKHGLTQPVTIIGVTKTHPASVISEALAAGITHIGESKVQEAGEKFAALSDAVFTRHMIGHLQTNKANKAAELFDWVHSLDSLELARRLARKSVELGREISVLIEVNTTGEESKAGITADEAILLADQAGQLAGLKLKGLMTIGPDTGNPADALPCFERLRLLRDQIRQTTGLTGFTELSMGMSGDYREAVSQGATMVRLGSILFGSRHYA